MQSNFDQNFVSFRRAVDSQPDHRIVINKSVGEMKSYTILPQDITQIGIGIIEENRIKTKVGNLYYKKR